MDFEMLFAGTPVTDFDVSVDWYTALFGRTADIPVTEDEVMWQFTDTAFLYVLRDPERAGRSVVTVSVPDLDAAVAEAAQRGIAGAPIVRVGTAGRKALFTDPDGNQVAIIEVNQPTG
jgi:predicted enzyme related to lactoylglutathione lyase